MIYEHAPLILITLLVYGVPLINKAIIFSTIFKSSEKAFRYAFTLSMLYTFLPFLLMTIDDSFWYFICIINSTPMCVYTLVTIINDEIRYMGSSFIPFEWVLVLMLV